MSEKINQMEPNYGWEEKRAVKDYLDSGGWIIEYKKTKEFEDRICQYTGAKYCSVVVNGTMSLFIALFALEIGSGDEVIVPNLTMIATPNAVVLSGAKPVLVDIDPKSLCLDVRKVEKKMSRKTKAVFHVSINGRAGDLRRLVALCQKKKIPLIEDAAQSFGSFYRGRHLGTYGLMGSFSFSTPKIITTGQGGALITNNKRIYQKICKVKDFGRVKGGVDVHDDWGWNFKFTDLQAAFGIAQIKKMKKRTRRKKEMYRLYQKELAGVEEVKFIETDLNQVSPWFIDILVPDPVKLRDYLAKKGIGARVFYPPVSDQKIYKTKEKFPYTKEIAYHGLWLPSSSFLTNRQIKKVCRQIKNYYR